MLFGIGVIGVPVHPRVCGELIMILATTSTLDGSSPRVWGTPTAKSVGYPYARFIPACVGNSLMLCCYSW